jgi:hypothetical protein
MHAPPPRCSKPTWHRPACVRLPAASAGTKVGMPMICHAILQWMPDACSHDYVGKARFN